MLMQLEHLRGGLSWLWSCRRWAYAAYMVLAVLRIPARTGFRLMLPACDLQLTARNAALSLTKMPHLILLAAFFLLTAVQFDRADRRTVGWCFLATLALGVLIEIEEGATRTGNCRITDVLPDAVGGLIAAVLVMIAVIIRRLLCAAASFAPQS